jgi:4-aminobutyrate aminotransferase
VQSAPNGFWTQVRASCDRHGALLIFDEISSCLGRTGAMFACEQAGAVPDILVIGKGLGGGIMPMAAMIARADLDIAGEGALGHYTHEKSPVGAAAALATLDVIEAQDLLARARQLGSYGLARLHDIAGHASAFGEVRGAGLYFGIEVRGRDRAEAAARADRILYGALQRGLSFKVGGGNIVTLCPPLTIETAQLDRAFDILAEAARDVTVA